MKINLPNQITLGRLVLAALFFFLLSLFHADDIENRRWLLKVCFWVFLIAAVGDILDGLLARVMDQVTSLGRVLDPVVDKVMICGAFVFFASEHFHHTATNANLTGVQAWMVVVILVRELLVSAIRSHREAEGQDFGASWVGKLKMFVQATTVCVVLAELAWFPTIAVARILCVWLTVIVTAFSIVSYLRRAHSFLQWSAEHGEADGNSGGEAVIEARSEEGGA